MQVDDHLRGLVAAAVESALRQVPTGDPGLTVEEAWEIYEAEHIPTLAVSGQDLTRFCWQNLRRHFGPLLPREVDQKVVNAYVRARRAGRIGRASKDVTIRREIAYLFSALRFAAKLRAIRPEDVNQVTPPATPLVAKRYLSIEEIQKLLDAAASMRRGDRLSRLERFIWLALETASRKTAILRLTWDRVDFEAGRIDFREPGVVVTKKRRAIVPISSSLLPVLLRAKEERTGRYVLDTATDGIWSSMQIAWAKAFDGAPTGRGRCPKGNGIGPHTLRHTAATMMARNDVSMFTVAGILANTPQITERVYAHYAPASPEGSTDQISRGLLRPPRE